MARLPRFFAEGYPLHVIQRSRNHAPVFRTEPDVLFFLDWLDRAAREHGLAVHAYVVMSNHFHLLATPEDEGSMPRALQSVGRRYAQYFNDTYRRSGGLWDGRYRSTVIDAAAYLLTCMRYIELNPVRASTMVKQPGDYPWSSYRGNALGAPDAVLTPHAIYRRLGSSRREQQAAYRKLFRSPIPASDLEAIRAATNKGWALGTLRSLSRIEAMANRRASPLPKGRPPGKTRR